MAETYQLLANPIQMINLERKRHTQTLRILSRIWERVAMRDASGGISAEFCRLCEVAPPQVNVFEYRQSCAHWDLRSTIADETSRMSVTVRRQAPSPYAYTPPPDQPAADTGQSVNIVTPDPEQSVDTGSLDDPSKDSDVGQDS